MTTEFVIELGRNTLHIAMLITAPLLLSVFVIGLLTSIIQAVTQINEMALNFIPKVIVAMIVLTMTGPWMLRILIEFTRRLIEGLPGMVG